MGDREAEIAEKAKYITLLKECLVESTVTLHQEGQLRTLWMQLDLAGYRVTVAEAKAIAIEVVVGVEKEEAVRGTRPQRSSRMR